MLMRRTTIAQKTRLNAVIRAPAPSLRPNMTVPLRPRKAFALAAAVIAIVVVLIPPPVPPGDAPMIIRAIVRMSAALLKPA